MLRHLYANIRGRFSFDWAISFQSGSLIMWFLCPCTFQFYCLFRFFFFLSPCKSSFGDIFLLLSLLTSCQTPSGAQLSGLMPVASPARGFQTGSHLLIYSSLQSSPLLSYSCFWLFCHFPVLVSIWASYSWWLDGSGSWLLDREE